MGLRDIGATLPPGFRFYPSDEELVCHYLYKKIANEEVLKGTLVEIDLHTCEPWQLPEVAKLNSTEWYFFSFRDRKYATGYRTNRATTCGYWKATGKDRTVVEPRSKAIIGMRKTLVFYKNRAPNGVKSGWIMHEFRLENPHIPPKEDWVLCRVFHKAKTENSEELSPQNMCETTTLPNSLNLADSQNQKLFPCGYNHHQNQNPNTNFLDLPALNPNFLHQSRGTNKAPDDEMANGDDDHYRFLFEMGFEEGGLGDAVPSNIDEMRFDDDIDDDHSLVFL